MNLANEMLEHQFGNGEVGYDTVLHGPNGFNVIGHTPQHTFGLMADSHQVFFAAWPSRVFDGDY